MNVCVCTRFISLLIANCTFPVLIAFTKSGKITQTHLPLGTLGACIWAVLFCFVLVKRRKDSYSLIDLA